MTESRRHFLRNLAAGTAVMALSGHISGKLKALTPINKPLPFLTVDPPVFPFWKYLQEYNFWDYIPRDQGGKFIQMALIGTEEDSKITAAIRDGVLENNYGNPTEWQKFERTEIEKSVWLNRLYFIPSFARMYHLTGDQSYLEDMMTWIRRWINDNPRLPDSHKTTYNWRDMQVAWRSILLTWCYYLCENGLSQEEKSIITGTLKEHADILISGFGQARLNEFNHQSHGALAMLYLGILFPELGEAEELRNRGILILNHHLSKAFYPDGGNVEQMFGYYPFEAHIFRDAYLLCKANGIEPPRESLPMMHKMRRFLVGVERPDGTVPQVNDSFEMPVGPTVETITGILGDGELSENALSVFFPETQVAVIRSKEAHNWYVLANPASVIGAHAHAGRLGFELWYRGKPIITDSGCCNYDDPALVTWYRTTRAHNTVIIDDLSDEATSSDMLWVPRRETLNRINQWETGDQLSFLTMVSSPGEAANNQVRWTRSLALVNDRFMVLNDHFETSGRHHYEVLFHFPPSQVAAINQGTSQSLRMDSEITLIPAGNMPGAEWEISKGWVSREGASVKAPIAKYVFEGEGDIHSCILFFPDGDHQSFPTVTLMKMKKYSLLKVKDRDGKTTRLKISAKGMKLL